MNGNWDIHETGFFSVVLLSKSYSNKIYSKNNLKKSYPIIRPLIYPIRFGKFRRVFTGLRGPEAVPEIEDLAAGALHHFLCYQLGS